MPKSKKCQDDITMFNTYIQRQRFYQFLAEINDFLDKEKRDLLQQDPLPTVDATYATIWREITRWGIINDRHFITRIRSFKYYQ